MSENDMNSPEVKAAIKAAVEEATSGLVAKRDELLGEVKKLRKNSEISPEDYQKLKDENESVTDQLAEAKKMLKSSASEIEAIKKIAETETTFVKQLLIDNGLNDSLLKVGVKPELSKAVKAMFSGQAAIKIDGEKRVAQINDKNLDDFISEWSKSDEGKHFIAAPINGGGDSRGSSGRGAEQTTISRNDFDAMTPSKKMELSKSGVKITE